MIGGARTSPDPLGYLIRTRAREWRATGRAQIQEIIEKAPLR